ncbi:MAG: ATP-binding cassette domain-containing protein [Mycoplasmatales bacterium]
MCNKEKLFINNLSLKFKNKEIINNSNIDLHFNKLQILGKNGSGKTSLLNYVYNKNLLNNKNICYIRQTSELFLEFTLTENLEIMCSNLTSFNKHISIFFEDINYNSKLYNFSIGELKIIYICIMLSYEYNIYFLDEPFNHLDNSNTIKLIDYLNNANFNLIIISHLDSINTDKKILIKDKEIHEVN